MSLGSTMPVAASAPGDRLDTLPLWPWGPFDRDAPPTLGWAAARWAETWLIQPNGPTAGQPFRCTSRQLRWLLWWYALDGDAQWLYQHGVRRLAKGSGKSPFAGVQALIEFAGPCRLERFDDREPGGCRAKAMDMPLVQIAATAESQTANTMRMVRAFAPKGSKVVEEHGLDPGKTRYYKLPEGTLEIITSSATAAEGAEASFVVGDQTERWKPSNGGQDLRSTLEDNLAKSGARMLETPNSWVPGAESVAEASWDAWLAQEEGRTVDDKAILYDAVIAPPSTDMADPDSLEAALQWVYADCTWKGSPPDVRPIMRQIWKLTTKPDDAKRKYLNWPTATEDAWIVPEKWRVLGDPSIHVSETDRVVLFFDGSKSRDATALVGCRVDDGHVFTVGVWEPDPNDPLSTVDVADVDRVVDLTFQTYNVVGFFSDVREWESFALTEWPRRYADRLVIQASPQGRPPQSIAWDMRGHVYEFCKACEAVEAEIIDGAFTHDGHPATSRHIGNARRRPYKDAVGIGKESKDSPRKIDAAVCVVGARMLRRLVLAAGEGKKQRSGVVW